MTKAYVEGIKFLKPVQVLYFEKILMSPSIRHFGLNMKIKKPDLVTRLDPVPKIKLLSSLFVTISLC